MLERRWLEIGIRYRRLLLMITATIVLLAVATIGFMYLEDLTFFDSLWMTIISVMTIGYGDIYPVTDQGRWFALFLVPAGAGIVTYGLGTGASYMIEKHLSEKVWEKKMGNEISKLEDHIIICGFGRVAQQVYKQLKEEHEDVKVLVIHDSEEEVLRLVNPATLRIIGDPTDKEILLKARVDKARALIAALASDADNVFITLTAKGLNEDIEIAARAEKDGSEEVLKKAGASRVINPSVIGGRELALSVLKPTGIDYINDLIRSEKKDFTVEEVQLGESSEHIGQTIEEANLRKRYGVTLVAIMRGKELMSNPDLAERLQNEDILISIGDQECIENLRNALEVKKHK